MPTPGLTPDERQLLQGAASLGLIRTGAWPDIAAQLLARGLDGEAMARLAGLSATDSAWAIAPLAADVLAEIGGQAPGVELASRVVARAVSQARLEDPTPGGYPAIRALAALSPGLDYPAGAMREAYYLEEWLDCDCHEGSAERARADEFEASLRANPLDADSRLVAAITAGWA